MENLDGVAVVGGGAVGGCIADALARVGRRPLLCLRPAFDRLEVTEDGKTRSPEVCLVTDSAQVRPVRWVLLATKAQDVDSAAPWLRALTANGTTVVVLQNGIDQERRAAPHAAAGASIVPATVYCAAERTAPGRIVHYGASRIHTPAGVDGEGVTSLFAGSSFAIVLESDFTTQAWSKLLGNVVAGPITALTLRRMPVFDEPAVIDLARHLMAEAVAVAQAEGAKLSTEDGDRAIGEFKFMRSAGSSMLYDRLAGRPLEHEFLTGAVVRAAGRHRIPVPMNRAILTLLASASGYPLDGSL